MHPEEFWRLAPHELSAVFVGASKQRDWWYEWGLFIAWHVAAFTSQAKVGKLQPWSEIRAKLIGTPDVPTAPVDWQSRKAQRTQQMKQFKKHQRQRSTPPVRRPQRG